MAKLNQIIAIEKDVKNKAKTGITALHRQMQISKAQLTGISRVYRPRDEQGEALPSESTRVQVRVTDALDQAQRIYVELMDTVLTKDAANSEAKADIVIDGQVIAEGVPVTHLLFLEKTLTDLHTLIAELPTLDPGEEWSWDDPQDAYRTPVIGTARSKKIPRNHVKADATQHHPAQVETYFEDQTVGYWDTIKYSGALPEARRTQLKARVVALLQAVKFAREEANSIQVQRRQIGENLFGYLYGE